MKQDLYAQPLLRKPSEHYWRAVAAQVRGFALNIPAEQALQDRHPDDIVAKMILRATSTQATLTDPAWAGPLARYSVSQAIQEIVSMSALSRLMLAGCLNIDLGRFANVTVPGRSTTPADAGAWVAEGDPIQAKQYALLGPVLQPHKMAVITSFTREMATASNIEDMVRVLIAEAAGPAIDAGIFSAAAASPQKSAGIMNGVTALTPTSGTFNFDNVGQDLGKLVGDLASRNGGAHAVFIASPAQATAIRFYAGGQFSISPQDDVLPVAGSAALAVGTIVCLEPSSFACSFQPPEFETGLMATIHMEDTTPVNPLLPATPVKSMFQIDAIALKMTLWGDWCMRAPHVSFMDAVQW
jgi:Phage capsid family